MLSSDWMQNASISLLGFNHFSKIMTTPSQVRGKGAEEGRGTSRNSAGGAVPNEMVLNLAPALGLSHSLLSADWDKAMGFYLTGREKNSGIVPHEYDLLYDNMGPTCA